MEPIINASATLEAPKHIDDVLAHLDVIIAETSNNEDTSGYFAALYKRVTQRIKEEVELNHFDDASRMIELDVVFAQRYLDAYKSNRQNLPVTQSWQQAFRQSDRYWPIVIQHLLLGMNAHINLDLGIAAMEVVGTHGLKDLKSDFYRINAILSSLVDEVQHRLVAIWPPLQYILQKTGKLDNLVTDFSMQLARDGAWKFANELASKPDEQYQPALMNRDKIIAKKASLITSPGLWVNTVLKIVRLTETGSVSEKIKMLSQINSL